MSNIISSSIISSDIKLSDKKDGRTIYCLSDLDNNQIVYDRLVCVMKKQGKIQEAAEQYVNAARKKIMQKLKV